MLHYLFYVSVILYLFCQIRRILTHEILRSSLKTHTHTHINEIADIQTNHDVYLSILTFLLFELEFIDSFLLFCNLIIKYLFRGVKVYLSLQLILYVLLLIFCFYLPLWLTKINLSKKQMLSFVFLR